IIKGALTVFIRSLAAAMDSIERSAPTMADAFYAGVPVFDGFNRIVEPALYKPLPDEWTLGLADIAGSTGVIAAGGYKAVNMAGSSAISAGGNAVGTPEFPFVFRGCVDGFALPS